MGSSVAGLLILTVLFTGALLHFRAGSVGDEVLGQALRESVRLETEQARTALSIDAAGASAVFRCDARVEATVRNSGETAIGDFTRVDVLTWYTPENGGPVTQPFTYTAGNLEKGEWALTGIAPDNGNRRWDPGETATLTWRFPQPQKEGTPGYLTIGAPNGVTDSAYVPFNEVPSGDCLFLHNYPTPVTGDTASQAVLPLDGGLPVAAPDVATVHNYDIDRDGAPGLKLLRSQIGLAESDPQKFQVWRTVPRTIPLVLQGDVLIDVWASLEPPNMGEPGVVLVHVRDYNAGAYTEIGEGAAFARNWQSGSTTFVERMALMQGLNYTVPAGHELEVRFVVDEASGRDIRFAFDTVAFPTLVNLAFVPPAPAVSLYLHNNPTPPVGDTARQAVLPLDTTFPTAATLYRYGVPNNNLGLLLQGSSNGLAETDPTKYQAWRTGVLAGPMAIAGDVFIDLWAAIRQFQLGQPGALTVYLRDYDGAAYVEVASGSVFVKDWQAGSAAFVKRTVMLPNVSYTIPAGHELEVRLITDSIKASKDLWIAYDTDVYPSVVKLP